MPPSRERTLFLVAGMLATGTANTLLNKVQDMQCVKNCDAPNPRDREYFEQPVFQTLNMFIGEVMCLVAVWVLGVWGRVQEGKVVVSGGGYDALIDESQAAADAPEYDGLSVLGEEAGVGAGAPAARIPLVGWKRCLLWLPSICDICGTTLMNIGLIYCSASVYQMLRGAVVLFSGIFSTLFLHHRMHSYQWLALFAVMLGVGMVGTSSILREAPPAASLPGAGEGSLRTADIDVEEGAEAMLGVLMVLAAQVFTATQFVVEEIILSKYEVEALLAVGLEGFFGATTVLAALPPLYLLIGRAHPGGYFDVYEGWDQFTRIPGVWMSGVAICFSIAFFNWFGLSVTRAVSATSRSTIDTCRTLFIWMASLALGWETLQWAASSMQVAGFGILLYGTFLFNGVVSPPAFLLASLPETGEEVETRPILSDA